MLRAMYNKTLVHQVSQHKCCVNLLTLEKQLFYNYISPENSVPASVLVVHHVLSPVCKHHNASSTEKFGRDIMIFTKHLL